MKRKDIKWSIDHTGGIYPHECYLEGKHDGHWFFKETRKDFWGIPLLYAKFCLTLRFKALAV